MKKTKILVLINPISGTGKQKDIAKEIEKRLDLDSFDLEIKETEYAGHAVSLSNEASKNGIDIVVAVGGDGTVNEVAQGVLYTETSMAIIPCGSGNGFARHIGISCSPLKAIDQFKNMISCEVDTLRVNDYLSVNVSGIGYDAFISHEFAKMNNRGLSSYIKAIFSSYFSYKDRSYKLRLENESKDVEAFMVSFANSSQFGNNAYIAPKASIQDGYFSVSAIAKPKWYQIPYLTFAFFTKRLDRCNIYKAYDCQSCEVEQSDTILHVDGEPVSSDKVLQVKLQRKSLKVMIPSKMMNKI
ncbi:diacylglycerol kinase family lipid kinase [Halosquirtibacter xylanolyticus]|uniref:diacylglycerol/lipid kinase family protein n=1 Tax=Halosquirtibacter xylanolyticus TaxID=3374599 RepID=UPI003748D2CE|nr:diacylglycerol kinase family lipid kinase [Prolixibacteraceae bacterium]